MKKGINRMMELSSRKPLFTEFEPEEEYPPTHYSTVLYSKLINREWVSEIDSIGKVPDRGDIIRINGLDFIVVNNTKDSILLEVM